MQNRCFAVTGWDGEVREFCREHGIVYQGFSLLPANVDVLHSQVVARVAGRVKATPAQVIFAFARQVGMVPLTGTSSAQHMKEDLASLSIELDEAEVRAIETIAV